MDNDIVALIPLRENSKGIKLKNIRPFAGEPLCWWVIKAASESGIFSKIYISTESELIKSVVKSFSCDIEIIHRPKELSQDDSSTESVMLHFSEQISFNTIVTIQATSPMVNHQDFINAKNLFFDNRFDSLLSCVPLYRFIWNKNGQPLNYNPLKRPLRKEISPFLVENGAFYFTNREILTNTYSRLGGKIGIYQMRPETFLELDEEVDWIAAEAIFTRGKLDD